MLHRFPTGVTGEKVHQKRLPARRARTGCETVRVHFPRWNRTADELCVQHPADVVWAVQMSTVEFHPWNSAPPDTSSGPTSGASTSTRCRDATYADVRRVAHVAHEVLDELGADRLAEDVGRQGHARLRADRPGLRASPTCGARRTRSPGRSGGAATWST